MVLVDCARLHNCGNGQYRCKWAGQLLKTVGGNHRGQYTVLVGHASQIIVEMYNRGGAGGPGTQLQKAVGESH
jgi:hypothetical protein